MSLQFHLVSIDMFSLFPNLESPLILYPPWTPDICAGLCLFYHVHKLIQLFAKRSRKASINQTGPDWAGAVGLVWSRDFQGPLIITVKSQGCFRKRESAGVIRPDRKPFRLFLISPVRRPLVPLHLRFVTAIHPRRTCKSDEKCAELRLEDRHCDGRDPVQDVAELKISHGQRVLGT